MALDGARKLGSYQLLSQLAVGGMAEIYVAKTRGVGGFEKLVALKVIHPNYSADPDFVQMLVDEAKLSVQLQHANIVQTFDLGRVDEQYYIAMELIDGIDLYKLLRRASEHEIDFPFEVAAFIAAEVCAGLDYAHRKRDPKGRPLKIVHRDVSPQNVLVSNDGEVKIVDFGIAKAAMRGQQTAAGVIKGKYYYMSPEQAWGDPIDARTDIFSAGILLYEMIVGQMLYLEEDLEKLLDVVRKANIPPPSSKRMGVPRELEAVVMRALKKRADERWPTAGELAQALTQFLHGFAPDFTRARLAAFVREVMGDDPTAERRDPGKSTAAAPPMGSGEVPRDRHSLLFKLAELKAESDSIPIVVETGAGTTPRRADVATSVRSDFEENDATIVDGAGETLLGRLDTDSDATRPAGPAVKRGKPGAPSGQFDLGDDDPAADRDLEAPTLAGDEDDAPTSSRALPRTHATRPIVPPDLDEESVSTPEPPVPSALPGLGAGDIAPTGARPPTPRPQPNAPRAPMPPANASRLGQPNAPRAVVDNAPGSAMDNAPTTPLDDTSTRERPRPGRPRAASLPSFADGEPEATVSARTRAPRRDPTPVPSRRDPTPPTPVTDSSQAPTVTLPPSQNPVAARASDVGARPPSHGGARSELGTRPPSHGALPRQSFEEPTRIPPAFPPPLDSGRFSGLDGDVVPFPSPLGEPEPLRKSSSRALWIIVGVVAALVTVAVVWYSFSTTGETRGTLSVVSLPPGAEVRIDGTAASTPTPLVVPDIDTRPAHRIRVSKGGYDVWEQDVKFPAGEREVRVQAVLAPTVGTVEIASTPPGAEAIVNGRIRGITPAVVGDLPPNDDVVIELRLRGYKVAHKTVSWAGKRKLAVSIPLEKAK